MIASSVNKELKVIWKEEIAVFEVLFEHLAHRTEADLKIPCQGSVQFEIWNPKFMNVKQEWYVLYLNV